jgi:hypothetical protein
MAVGVHPCVGVRTGREVRRPTGERDEPVSCCSAIGARDQAPDPDAVGQRPGSLAFNTFFVFMPNHLAATKKAGSGHNSVDHGSGVGGNGGRGVGAGPVRCRTGPVREPGGLLGLGRPAALAGDCLRATV